MSEETSRLPDFVRRLARGLGGLVPFVGGSVWLSHAETPNTRPRPCRHWQPERPRPWEMGSHLEAIVVLVLGGGSGGDMHAGVCLFSLRTVNSSSLPVADV